MAAGQSETSPGGHSVSYKLGRHNCSQCSPPHCGAPKKRFANCAQSSSRDRKLPHRFRSVKSRTASSTGRAVRASRRLQFAEFRTSRARGRAGHVPSHFQHTATPSAGPARPDIEPHARIPTPGRNAPISPLVRWPRDIGCMPSLTVHHVRKASRSRLRAAEREALKNSVETKIVVKAVIGDSSGRAALERSGLKYSLPCRAILYRHRAGNAKNRACPCGSGDGREDYRALEPVQLSRPETEIHRKGDDRESRCRLAIDESRRNARFQLGNSMAGRGPGRHRCQIAEVRAAVNWLSSGCSESLR